MRNILRKYGFTIAIICILILVCVILFYSLSFNRLINENQDRIIGALTRQVKRAMDVEMSIGGLHAEFPFSVSLENVTMRDTDSTPLLEIQSVTLKADWMGIIRSPEDSLSSIRYIELDKPLIKATFDDGKLNWLDVFQIKEPKQPALAWEKVNLKLLINDCRAELNYNGESPFGDIKTVVLPISLNGDILLIDGNIVLHPHVKAYWIDQNASGSGVLKRMIGGHKTLLEVGGSGNLFERIHLTGKINLSGISNYMEFLSVFVKEIKGWKLPSDPITGKFDVNIHNLISDKPEFIANLELNADKVIVKPGVLWADEINFEKCIARYAYPSNQVQIHAKGILDETNFETFMNMDDLRDGILIGYAKIPDFDLSRLPSEEIGLKQPLSGLLNLGFAVSGEFNNLLVNGTVESPSVSIGSQEFVLEKSEFYYSAGVVSIPDLSMESDYSGRIGISSTANLTQDSVDAKIETTGLPYDFYSELFGFKIPVAVNVSPKVESLLHYEKGNSGVEIAIQSNEGTIINVPFDRMSGSISIKNNDMKIEPLEFSLATGGMISVEGSINDSKDISLNIDLAEASFGDFDFSQFDLENPVGGTFFGNASISGTVSNPEAEIHLRAYDGRLFSWQFQKGEFDARIDSTGIRNVVAKIDATGSKIELNADYVFKDERPLVVWGTWENIPLEQLGFQAMNTNLMLKGSGSFIGDADDLNGVIKLALDGDDMFGNRVSTPIDPVQPINPMDPFDFTDPEGTQNRVFYGTFLNIDIAKLSRFGSVEELISQLSELGEDDFKSEGFISKGELKVSGGLLYESFAPESELYSLMDTLRKDILPLLPDVSLNLPEKSLSKGPSLLLDGELLLDNFSLKREDEQWKIAAAASGRNFKINKEQIAEFNAEIQIPASEVGRNNLKMNLLQSDGGISINGKIGFDQILGTSPLDLDVRIDSYPLKSLARMSRKDSGENFSGFIQGGGKLTGTFTNLNLEDINLAFESAEIFGMPIENTNLKFSLIGKTINIDNFEISDNTGFHAIAVGILELDPEKITENRLNLRIDNFPLNKLQATRIVPKGFDGLLSLITQLEYDAQSRVPKLYIDLQIEKPKFNWFELESISGQGIIDGKTGTLKLGQLECDAGNSMFSVSGEIIPGFGNGAAGLNLRMKAESYEYASILNQLGMSIHGEDMLANVDLKFTGTTSAPVINGSLEASVNNPRMETIELAKNVQLNLDVKNNVLSIDGTASDGDSLLKATGNIDIARYLSNGTSRNDTVPSIQLRNVDSKPFRFKNFGADVRLMFSGTGDDPFELLLYNDKAKLAGKINIVDGRYKVSPVPITSKGSSAHPVVLDLILDIPAGFPVTSGSNLDIILEHSTLDIVGTLSYPTASGKIKVLDGDLRLLDRTFTIESGELQFKEFLGVDNPRLIAQATTTIVSRSIRNLQGTENLVVTANIDAQLRQLTNGLVFSSNRGTLTENELTGIILRQDIFQDFQDEGLLTTLSQQALTIPGAFVSRYFESKGGFQQFQVGLDYNNDVFINFEYEIFEDFFLDYYHLFSSKPELDAFLKYKFRKDSFVGLGINEKGAVVIKVDYIIPIN